MPADDPVLAGRSKADLAYAGEGSKSMALV